MKSLNSGKRILVVQERRMYVMTAVRSAIYAHSVRRKKMNELDREIVDFCMHVLAGLSSMTTGSFEDILDEAKVMGMELNDQSQAAVDALADGLYAHVEEYMRIHGG